MLDKNEMKKSELKKRADGDWENEHGTIFIEMRDGSLWSESAIIEAARRKDAKLEGFKSPKVQNRLWFIGVIVVLIMLVFSSQLQGYDPATQLDRDAQAQSVYCVPEGGLK